jgi:hypothetical protein
MVSKKPLIKCMLRRFSLVAKMLQGMPAARNVQGKAKHPPKEETNANLVETNQAPVDPRKNPSKKDLRRDSTTTKIHETTRASRATLQTTREAILSTNRI